MRIRSITKINKQFIFTASFCLFLVLYIFNGYEFGAPFGQTILPISIVLVASLFTKHEHDYKYYFLIMILAILALISTANSNVINFSQSRIWTFLLICSICAWIGGVRISKEYLEEIMSFYIILSFVIVLLIVVGYILGFGVDSSGRVSINYGDFFKDQNYLSAFFLPSFAIVFYRIIYSYKGRIKNILFCVLSIFAVFTMGSRGSFLTILLIVASVVGKMFLKDRNMVRKIAFIFLLVITVLVLYYLFQSLTMFQRMTGFESYGSDVRMRLWAAGINGFINNPLIGSGIGAASQYSWSLVGKAVHNSFIELLADQGLLGAIVIVWILLHFLNRGNKNGFIVFILMISFFVPLFFLTGYSNFTFWMPIMFINLITNNLKNSQTILFDMRSS